MKKLEGVWPFLLILLLVIMVLVGLRIDPVNRLAMWLVILGCLIGFAVISGRWVTGFWLGVLIDERNKITLSRLQLLLWTILVLSGFLCAALSNLQLATTDPLQALDIAIPSDLWLLMGISVTSLVSSQIVKASKEGSKQVAPAFDRQRTVGLLEDKGTVRSSLAFNGLMVVNNKPDQANLTDLFTGEEIGNAAQLDIGKLQMFFFTVVIVAAYGAALASAFQAAAASTQPFLEFPEMTSQAVTLLGISHAGYIANKAAPHTPTT